MASTDLFLTHNWGEDKYGRNNHARVKQINEILKKKGYTTWFDDDRMHGDIQEQMAEGIDGTKVVIAFITDRYRSKVNGKNDNDNCRKEFRYASEQKPIIAVVMEKEMKKPREWKGVLGMCLGSHIFVDMSADYTAVYLNNKVVEIIELINKKIGEGRKGKALEKTSLKSTSPSKAAIPRTEAKVTKGKMLDKKAPPTLAASTGKKEKLSTDKGVRTKAGQQATPAKLPNQKPSPAPAPKKEGQSTDKGIRLKADQQVTRGKLPDKETSSTPISPNDKKEKLHQGVRGRSDEKVSKGKLSDKKLSSTPPSSKNEKAYTGVRHRDDQQVTKNKLSDNTLISANDKRENMCTDEDVRSKEDQEGKFKDVVHQVLRSGNSQLLKLLHITALMDGKVIEVSLLRSARTYQEESLKQLEQYTLLHRHDSNLYTMDDSTQIALQKQMSVDDTLNALKSLIDIISAYKKQFCNRNNTNYGDVWSHHLIHLIQRFHQTAEIMGILEEQKFDVVRALTNKGDYKSGVDCLQKFLNYELSNDGLSEKTILWTKYSLACCLRDVCSYANAQELFEAVLKESKQICDDDDRLTLDATNGFALSMEKQGDYTAARILYQEAYAKSKTVLGEKNPSTLTVMNKLALCMRKQGDNSAARVLYEEVSKKSKNILGENHPDTLLSMNNLAVCMKNQGDHVAARDLYEEVCAKRKMIFGKDHPDTLLSMHNLAGCLASQGELDAAVAMLREVYEKRKNVIGENHPDTLLTKGWLDDCLKHLPRK